ncbi:MAG: hypothetical protein IIA27_08050 [Gemmatimonadetes bacterium]|nr:hypothetical protein [Gemmatimonadota bacterium]
MNLEHKVEFDPPGNALFRDAELAFRVELPVIGIPVRFESNSRQVIDVVNASFGVWKQLERHPELIAAERARVRLFVHEGQEDAAPHAKVAYRCPDPDRLLFATHGSFGVAEADRLEAYAFVTPDLVADTAHFQYSVLEALTLMLVTGRDRHPIHAATVARAGAAILLVGPTSTGKSTLAYAAALRGLTVLGEDVAYVQLEPDFRVWALPGRLHLPPDAPRHFPQLAGRVPTLQANGKEKIAVEVPTEGSDAVTPTNTPIPAVSSAVVCLLSRGARSAETERVEASEIRSALLDDLEPGFDRHPATVGLAAEALAGGGGWRLHMSNDPHESIPLIQRMLDDLIASSIKRYLLP